MKNLIIIVASLFLLSSCNYKNPAHINVEFSNQICLTPSPQDRFKLCDNMIVHVDNEYHVVPRGFVTDLASIPRVLWPFFWPDDYDSIASSILHDWHYCCDKTISRKRADDIFYNGQISRGASKIKAFIYYIGIRNVGWIYFTNGLGIEKHEPEIQNGELQGIYDDINYDMG